MSTLSVAGLSYSHGAANFFRDDDPFEVVDLADDSGSFHKIKSPLTFLVLVLLSIFCCQKKFMQKKKVLRDFRTTVNLFYASHKPDIFADGKLFRYNLIRETV